MTDLVCGHECPVVMHRNATKVDGVMVRCTLPAGHALRGVLHVYITDDVKIMWPVNRDADRKREEKKDNEQR